MSDSGSSDSLSLSEAEATYELLNSEVTERLVQLRSATERIETKASFLAGFTATASTVLVESGLADRPRKVALILLGASFVSSVVAFAVWRWDDPPRPDALISRHKDSRRIEVLAEVVGTKAGAYSDNKTHQNWKAVAWYLATALLGTSLLILLVPTLT